MFRHLRKISKPRRGFKNEIWLQIQERSGFSSPRLARPLIFQPAFLALILFLLGSFAAGAYAYTSSDVLEDHPLYPIKKTMEDVEVRLARSPENQVKVRARLATRRLREIERLAKKKQVVRAQTLEKLEKELDDAENILPMIKNPEKQERVRNLLGEIRVKKIQRIERALQDKQIKNPEVLEKYAQKHSRSRLEDVSAEDKINKREIFEERSKIFLKENRDLNSKKEYEERK